MQSKPRINRNLLCLLLPSLRIFIAIISIYFPLNKWFKYLTQVFLIRLYRYTTKFNRISFKCLKIKYLLAYLRMNNIISIIAKLVFRNVFWINVFAVISNHITNPVQCTYLGRKHQKWSMEIVSVSQRSWRPLVIYLQCFL